MSFINCECFVLCFVSAWCIIFVMCVLCMFCFTVVLMPWLKIHLQLRNIIIKIFKEKHDNNSWSNKAYNGMTGCYAQMTIEFTR
jgi:hypothetical protein